MADIFSRAERSAIMATIRSRGNNSTERRLMEILKLHGISGWRRNAKLFGNPDFVFIGARVAIFIDGCFWHGCPRHCRTPNTNRDYWEMKIDRNRARDRIVSRKLRADGWAVLRIWEHALRVPASTVRRLSAMLNSPPKLRDRESVWIAVAHA